MTTEGGGRGSNHGRGDRGRGRASRSESTSREMSRDETSASSRGCLPRPRFRQRRSSRLRLRVSRRRKRPRRGAYRGGDGGLDVRGGGATGLGGGGHGDVRGGRGERGRGLAGGQGDTGAEGGRPIVPLAKTHGDGVRSVWATLLGGGAGRARRAVDARASMCPVGCQPGRGTSAVPRPPMRISKRTRRPGRAVARDSKSKTKTRVCRSQTRLLNFHYFVTRHPRE